jgi:hypothetical protein
MQARSVDDQWTDLCKELPDGWREASRTTRAIRRDQGPLSEPETLLRLVLGHVGGDKSFRGVVAHARESGLCDVSDVALFKREKRCSEWLEWIANAMLRDTVTDLPETAPYRLRLMDATSASRPGSDGSDFRLHVHVELPGRRFTGAELTDGRGGESFTRLTIAPGDLLVADRIYATEAGIARVVGQGGAVLVRTNAVSLPLWTKDGVRLEVLDAARKLDPGQQMELDVEVRPRTGPAVAGRLCIQALPAEHAKKAQDRVRRTKLRRGKHPGQIAVESAKYVFVFTTVPRSHMTTSQVLATYRLRWQVELAFKTIKTVLHYGDLPNRLPSTGRTWLLAKLVCALLLERLAHSAMAIPPSTPQT